jgi:farnesyl diphosphate synthase
MKMAKTKFSSFLSDCQNRLNQQLHELFITQKSPSPRLHEAMQYSALAGGKRIRPLLIYATGEAFDVPLSHLDKPAMAVELLHTYSLIHDDLPAMDNDVLRRGKPTCHIAFDEASAILAGDAMQTLAFEILSAPNQHLDAHQQLRMIFILSRACGIHGMASGQALDLATLGENITQDELQHIHELKTGALISACIELALVPSQASPEQITHMQIFAQAIGLAFQVQDDLLDVIGDPNELGKPTGMDAKRDKLNYPAIIGVEASQNLLKNLVTNALDHLHLATKKPTYLKELTQLIIERNA